jgi:N-acetylglucosamine-6-phosphate deacetylase
MTQHAVAASHIFDGAELHRDAAVVIDGVTIVALMPRSELPRMRVHQLPDGAWLVPGFIDIQVNGGGDVLFNDKPTPDGIRAILQAHRNFGTTSLLPTLISDTRQKMAAAIGAVQAIIDREPGVLGIHLEGPFLSPQRPGVHDPAMLRRPDDVDFQLLTAPRKGAMLVTLAPEQVPAHFITKLVGAGIEVSLGHSNATYDQTRGALAEGLSGFTHLFNAMRPMTSRDPGPIAAALESYGVWYGLIADRVHVEPAVLRVALRGAGHPILVTDAMPPVGGRRAGFTLNGNDIAVRDGRCLRQDGTLAGSVLTMIEAVRNCVDWLDTPLQRALRLASTNPADFLGIGHELGRLREKYRADMVALDPERIDVLDTWVAGQRATENAVSEATA